MSSTKRKAPPVRIAKPQITTSAKPTTRPRLNDKLSVVAVPKQQQQKQSKKADAAIEISSDEDDLDDDDVEADETTKIGEQDTDMTDLPQTNGAAKEDTNDEAHNDDDDADADAEPTFGDLVREHGTVDVAAALGLLNPADSNGDASAVVKSGAAGAAAPNLASLGQLLNAALRSGDDANLELCFTTTSSTDSSWVRNTIQRLDPSLAGTLLQKLAARIHRRPGRAHTLIGWVQWTLITHGGALLTNQPGVTTRALQELHRVLEERARGLNSLLLLKGKLDMLEAQMQLRRVQRGGRAVSGMGGDAYQPDAAAVGRVASSAVDGINGRRAGRRRRGVAGGPSKGSAQPGFKVYREGRDDLEEDDEDEDGAEDEAGQILVNGAEIAGESFVDGSDDEVEALDEEDEEDSEQDDEGGDDAEDDDVAEEDEDAGEDEVDFDDVDDDDDDDDDDDEIEASTAAAPPPAKMQKKAGGAFSKRR